MSDLTRSQVTTLRHDVEDGILTVTLDRPDSLNAFTVEMADELEATFVEVNDREDVRAVIVTGAGKAFSVGMDLKRPGNPFGLDESLRPNLADMADLDDPGLRRVRDTGGRVTLAAHACRKPVIAAVNGIAVGIGATMTLAMDARLSSTESSFGFVFGRIGVTPEAASTWFLPRIVGMSTALDLVYSGDIITAEDAAECGLVRSVHEPRDLLPAARRLADRWTRGRTPAGTALARQMRYRNSARPDPTDAHRVDSLSMFYMSIGDGKEGVAAFREKRDPVFRASAVTDLPPFYDEWSRPT